MSRLDWMADALCAQTDPALFHPEGVGAGYRDARRVCANCPVQRECGDYAQDVEGDVSHSHRYGLWGGQLPRQRADAADCKDSNTRRHEHILRLVDRGGLDAYQIADAVGCDPRTVWRVTKARREQMGEAA
ncbi:WhiB family transcriptional regulator [Streptomyces europaeiscabiei]|uniref:WhiB family transcriptional regulator n=1 Tax=Streptomyces europaeiscabiei TaxID=146819 RepID=UPI0029A0B4C6|nr:WhiB family transcriptional regulator [Streptomyces europaeiscabiei]MDX2761606.1 WhiB family transcriptional regulator [Streptomyces europaeiscabiei]